MVAWVFFRAASVSDAWLILGRIITSGLADPLFPLLLGALVLSVWVYQYVYESRFRQIVSTGPVRVALIVAMPVLNTLQNKILEVTSSSAADSIKVYNLLALSYHEHRNLFPGEWTEPQSREIVNACYSPVQWDTAWTGQCGFIYTELQRQQLWGSSQLTRVWLREIFDHPVVYFSALAATFKKSMFRPNSSAMLYNTPNPWNWQVADNPPRPSTYIAQRYIGSKFNRVGRPLVYVLLSALSIVLLFRMRAVATEEGLFALAILTSGLVYLLTYFCRPC